MLDNYSLYASKQHHIQVSCSSNASRALKRGRNISGKANSVYAVVFFHGASKSSGNATRRVGSIVLSDTMSCG